MEKTLVLDLGNNLIGAALRVGNEFKWFGVKTFKKGVGVGKSGEFSLAAERASHRSKRRLYNARRYRKWEVLKVLIESGYCPLSIEDLNRWKYYKKGEGRVYPLGNKKFDEWIKLDFDGNGVPDFSSPYQLRRYLINEKLNLSDAQNRKMLGRAIYHIAQRRGFKSSRKGGGNEKTAVYEGSTDTDAVPVNEYHSLIKAQGTLGAALAKLEDDGVRIRNRYTLRKDYEVEVKKIAEVQELDDDLRARILKAIFFQRPLRSQKGLIGKCTLEPTKAKCPISHPRFELYRAWAFINNIEYYNYDVEDWQKLPIEWKRYLLSDCFLRLRTSFKFGEIRKNINQYAGKKLTLNYDVRQGRIDKKKNLASVNKISVSGCPVAGRLKTVLGEDWINWKYETVRIKNIRDKQKEQKKSYTVDDLWHILFSFEDEDYFEEYCIKVLGFSEDNTKALLTLWKNFPVGYASLSLKAIKNISAFLEEGFIYTEAVLLAKIPELIGQEKFKENNILLTREIQNIIAQNRRNKRILNITNNLISKYYNLQGIERFAHKDFDYKLAESDRQDVENACIQHYGQKRWENMEATERESIQAVVREKYQQFFSDHKRKHFKLPRVIDQINEFLKDNFDLDKERLEKLYHPSQVDIYPEAQPESDGKCYFGSPKTGAFKNPMAMRTMHELRSMINKLIEDGLIDQETRIVVEAARGLNYANMRWAIERHQRNRENENKEFAIAISELIDDPEFHGQADPNSKSDIEKFRLWVEQMENFEDVLKVVSAKKEDIEKYYHWKEQECRCMYTGNFISLTDLFDTNRVDFEHTIPRSRSFDNSLANRTVAYADYNRNVKGNKLPTELPNYLMDTREGTAIKPRLEIWENRLKSYKEKIERAVAASKAAQDKDSKDQAIRKKHLAQFQYDYWENKLDRFIREDLPTGWKNSQLVDTQIVSKYAFHYLKSVFNRVDVQKGSNTAQFRKIYQVQGTEEKNRSKHSHHAVDAAVLTMIPSPAKMKEILHKAYLYEEKHGKQYTEEPFKGFHQSQITDIENRILIYQKSKNQALVPGSKKVRKRGKIEYLRDANGDFRRDHKGSKIPKMAKGDSIRGQLHLDTFYGKIKVVERENDGKPVRDDDGKLVFAKKNGEDEMWMVERVMVSDNKFKIDNVVDPLLRKHLAAQVLEGVALTELTDFAGNRIRHVRCRVKAGRGYLAPENVTILKKQTYPSKHDYKSYYYTNSGDNYAFGLYESDDNKRKIVGRNLFEVSKIQSSKEITSITDLFEPTIPIGKGTSVGKLAHVFQEGQRVLIYLNSKEELPDLDEKELSKRLYYVRLLFDAKTQRIQFQHHLEARSDEDLLKAFPRENFGTKAKDGFSSFSEDFIAPRLLLTPTKFNFAIEGKDFYFTELGEIKFRELDKSF